MPGTVLHGPGDVRYERVEDPRILKPTGAIIRLSATRVPGPLALSRPQRHLAPQGP